ncbi:hypothetical protein HME9304_01737 [Flagellimonas maritima]|uniref:Uncharacterized protein n=1 Tax=Flagellimonas maritima TaxID=1383885 RepID=A0A2Z4LT27_9FLAO|nr:hypothetical protein [Allomuricauda aurantiaca]AWX44734.1 hypothetical protein HME9304_01737 [Allomuricauda aurantiaca]
MKPFYPLIAIMVVATIALIWTPEVKKNHESLTGVKKHEHDIGYIDPSKARLNKGFHVCNKSRIFQYYNPEKATYSKGKNGLRRFILENYKNKNYNDSGYLTIRFVINCKGKAGRYIIHENDLNLMPKHFDPDLVEQIFELTSKLEKWNPNFIFEEYRDSYMYLSYRIENGEITEILP